jgi:phage shock protein PspC (stress-responsive transcriptional regulator)
MYLYWSYKSIKILKGKIYSIDEAILTLIWLIFTFLSIVGLFNIYVLTYIMNTFR